MSVPEGQVLVRIAGIGGAADYLRAMAVFRNSDAVGAYSVVASEPDAVIVSVTPKEAGQGVSRALGADDALREDPGGGTGAPTGVALFYRLNP